jgi:Flp pilus assembly protein TadB
MRRIALIFLVLLTILLSSCTSYRSSRAIRKAERMMAKQEAQAEKDYERALDSHYKHQAPKTKKMIREDRRRARRLNRNLRRY